MILDLLLINLIVALVYKSGFWDSLDGYINERFRFYHIPHILSCTLCQTFWLSVLYMLITNNITLLALVLCLVNAHLNIIIIAVISSILNFLMEIINGINKMLNL